MVKKETAISGIWEKGKRILQAELTSFLPRSLARWLSFVIICSPCVRGGGRAGARALSFLHSSLFSLFQCSVHVLWRNFGFFCSVFAQCDCSSSVVWNEVLGVRMKAGAGVADRCGEEEEEYRALWWRFFCRDTLLSKSAPSICTPKFCSRRVFFSLSPLLSLCWCFLLRLLF